MPEPTITPSRLGSANLPEKPASAHASGAGISANGAERSRRRISTGLSSSDGSTAIRAASRTGGGSAQSSVRVRTPERPASSPSQNEAASPPSGVVAPIPVTTTDLRAVTSLTFYLWIYGCYWPDDLVLLDLVLLDVRDRVAHRGQVLDRVVPDLHAELLLGGHDDLDHGQRVDVQVAGERLVQLHLGLVDARDLFDDLGEVREDLFLGQSHEWRSLDCFFLG